MNHTHTVLGYKYLLPRDDWGRHSPHLTGQVHLCPGDVVNTPGWNDDHRSWEKTREHNFTLPGPKHPTSGVQSLLGPSNVRGAAADESCPHRTNGRSGRESWKRVCLRPGRGPACFLTHHLCSTNRTTGVRRGKTTSQSHPRHQWQSSCLVTLPSRAPGCHLLSAQLHNRVAGSGRGWCHFADSRVF